MLSGLLLVNLVVFVYLCKNLFSNCFCKNAYYSCKFFCNPLVFSSSVSSDLITESYWCSHIRVGESSQYHTKLFQKPLGLTILAHFFIKSPAAFRNQLILVLWYWQLPKTRLWLLTGKSVEISHHFHSSPFKINSEMSQEIWR